MSGHNELSLALTDVRRAYRLLWAYQRRMLDTIHVIADAFEEHAFYVWTPTYFDPPCRYTKDPLENWAWDMLPMVAISYLCLPFGADRNRPKAGEWMLEIYLVSDTGFELLETRNEPDSKAFEPAEMTASEIWLYAWQCMASVELNWLAKVWGPLDRPNEEGILVELKQHPFRVLGKKFDISTLSDRDAIKRAVVEFRAIISSKMEIKLASV